MAEAFTELHLVNNLEQALAVATSMEAVAVGLDVEGVLHRYIGNTPTVENTPSYPHRNIQVMRRYLRDNPHVQAGLMTNNTNARFPGLNYGLVDYVADNVGYYGTIIGGTRVPFVHKGMELSGGGTVSAKPSGEQAKLLAEILDVDPAKMVLIDDQGVKNMGEAVKGGFMAHIATNPIGVRNKFNRIVEHGGVMASRFAEPLIFSSLERRGAVARFAYEKIAGIDIDQIAHFEDHRKAAQAAS